MTEDEMVGWHHRLSGHEFEQALGVGDGQGHLLRRLSLIYCIFSPPLSKIRCPILLRPHGL